MRQIKHNTESVLWEWNYNRSPLPAKNPTGGKPQTLRDFICPPPPLRAPTPRTAEVVEAQHVPFCWGGVGAGVRNVNFFRALLIEFDHHVGRTPVKRRWGKELPRVSGRFPQGAKSANGLERSFQPSEL